MALCLGLHHVVSDQNRKRVKINLQYPQMQQGHPITGGLEIATVFCGTVMPQLSAYSDVMILSSNKNCEDLALSDSQQRTTVDILQSDSLRIMESFQNNEQYSGFRITRNTEAVGAMQNHQKYYAYTALLLIMQNSQEGLKQDNYCNFNIRI
ncbi:hypothetical protein BDA99DRAFT_543558 [Phascolomyces articulosus]|uniref:Uncharacterized protein n=1 Tax=Phascolomyces articulosus TaxID=60185 RepID=A0AAD5K0J6_9FUNG|nr:hypothetical protein BDA99DRAFT_543558 [Phascolomyces articulosus]